MKNLTAISLILLSLSSGAETYKVSLGSYEYLPFKSNAPNTPSFIKIILNRFAKDNNHTLNYVHLPTRRSQNAFLQGTVDIKFPENPTWSRHKKKETTVFYSQIVTFTTEGIVSEIDREIKKVGSLSGFTPWSIKEKIDSGEIKLVEANSVRQLLDLYKAKRIDGIFGSEEVITREGKKVGLKLKINNSYKSYEAKFHIASASNKKLIDQFDSWFKSNKTFVKEVKTRFTVK